MFDLKATKLLNHLRDSFYIMKIFAWSGGTPFGMSLFSTISAISNKKGYKSSRISISFFITVSFEIDYELPSNMV
jgi:hypothetical protein